MQVFPGQKIITTQGTVRIVAYISRYGVVHAYPIRPNGAFEVVKPRYEAWGGEHDPDMRNAA